MWSLAIPAITGILGALGGGGKGAAQERGNQNDWISRNNQATASMYGTQQGSILEALGLGSREQTDQAGVDLARRKFALDAPTTRANQSVRGSLMASAQPTRFDNLPSRITRPTISGGFSGAIKNLGGDTRALGREMMAKALRDQMAGDTFDPMERTDFKSGLIAPPTLQGYQQPGKLESGLSWAGIGGGILGALLPLILKQGEGSGLEPPPMGAG